MVMRPADLVPLVAVLGIVSTVAIVVWLSYRRSRDRIQARSDFHKLLLDKFSSGSELSEFLGTKGSQRFLEEMWAVKTVSTKGRILKTVSAGVILSTLGLALLLISLTENRSTEPGIIVLALGAGFLGSAAISYRLSQKWGLVKEEAAPPTPKLSGEAQG